MKIVNRLTIAWAILLTAIILFAQQPGGFEHSLAWDNLWGGWGMLYLKLVVIPWFVLSAIAAVIAAALGR